MNRSDLNVVFLDQGSLSHENLSFDRLLENFPNTRFYENSASDEVAERTREADVVITNKAILNASILEQSQQLKMISVIATGYNNVDIEAARRQDITVTNVRSYGTPSIAQHVMMLILNLATRFPDYSQAVQRGAWNNASQFCLLDYKIIELYGKKLGIVGYGELGKAVGQVASAFGMEILVSNRKGNSNTSEGRVSFDTVIEQSDILTLHCPLTDETRDLIAGPELERMKQSAFLINAARGGVVNEVALREALISGQIAGAAFDVLSEEPPKNGNILLNDSIPNLIITPHTAWASLESQQRLLDKAIQNIIAFVNGTPENVVS